MPAPPSPALSCIPPSPTVPQATQSPTPTPTAPSPPASPAPPTTSPAPTTPPTSSPHRGNPQIPTEPHRTAPRPGPRPPRNTSQQAQHTTSHQASELTGNGTAERARHHPHASPTLSYTALQHRSHTVPRLPPTGRALQLTPRWTTTTTFSRPSNTHWQPRPRAHKPTSKPRNRRNPTTPCHPAPYPPQPPRTRTRNTSEGNPTTPPRPRAPPPLPQGHLRHTSRHPGPPHGRRAVLPIRPTRGPSRPRDPPGVEAGESKRQRVGHGGRPSLGRHLERHHGHLPGSSIRPTPARPGTPGTASTPS